MFERFSRSARTAIVVAQEDARELHASNIEVEHVLLGVLAQAEPELTTLLAEAGLTRDSVRRALAEQGNGIPLGPEDAEALRSIGIDLDAVRESLEAHFGEDALDRAAPDPRRGPFPWSRGGYYGHIPFTKDAKKVLELALREALGRKDKTIESGHMLLGILRAPNQTTERLLGGSAAIGELRPKVHALLDRAA
ncbi:Clp protease N-terminal domain-containing protein [Nocardia beijingensis]|uniref:Clp protease N-terminal domain-containing protein n=1 Tax=Nocardia beijingensis TaxID=95162 RepID=A0ABW7WNU8_9NOCA|nr:Clp protease N-terminal domain-containing protein [Nocardia beijingensis]MBF6077720.1 Clp protease [Nocardia beijingensis]